MIAELPVFLLMSLRFRGSLCNFHQATRKLDCTVHSLNRNLTAAQKKRPHGRLEETPAGFYDNVLNLIALWAFATYCPSHSTRTALSCRLLLQPWQKGSSRKKRMHTKSDADSRKC